MFSTLPARQQPRTSDADASGQFLLTSTIPFRFRFLPFSRAPLLLFDLAGVRRCNDHHSPSTFHHRKPIGNQMARCRSDTMNPARHHCACDR
jgi:hypothetical protein